MSILKDYFVRYGVAQIPEKTYPEKMLSPSMLGGCARVMYYKLNGVEMTTPPNTGAIQNFQVGHSFEQALAGWLKDAGVLDKWWIDGQRKDISFEQWGDFVTTEKWLPPELHLAGSPDIIYEFTYEQMQNIAKELGFFDDMEVKPFKGTQRILLDAKTQKDSSARFCIAAMKKGTYWEENEGQEYQLGSYLVMGEYLEKNLNYGQLGIFSKDNGSIIACPTLILDEKLAKKIKDRCDYLWGFIERDELPPCECGLTPRTKWQIQYCNYGVKETMAPNSKKLVVPTECCKVEL